ncbi:MAG: methylamine utilization protein [Pseudomonadota bacterium]
MIKSLFKLGYIGRGCLSLLLVGTAPAWAASLQAELVDLNDKPLANAVLSLRGPLGAETGPATAVMDQVQLQFAPSVLAVKTGTRVSFPNSDNIRHHVYSFSPSKRFELRLYQGTPSEPVLFDQPGVVVLGCNIHDAMVGYLYVTDDPWFAVSDAQGRLQLEQLPVGRYAATLWHPDTPDRQAQPAGELQVDEKGLSQRFQLAVQATSPQAPAAPTAFGDAFRKATRASE